MSTRRLVTFVGGILILSTTFLIITSANLSTDKLHHAVKFDFGFPATHAPPPPPRNGTASASGWFPSWTWKNPFSDDKDRHNRVALPHIDRCSIYSYYEPIADKGAAAVEDRMLLVWRRAWWAQGFKPMILGPAEAKRSKYYDGLAHLKLAPELVAELMRWLALDYVEGAVLVDHRVSLRRGVRLTRLRARGLTRFAAGAPHGSPRRRVDRRHPQVPEV